MLGSTSILALALSFARLGGASVSPAQAVIGPPSPAVHTVDEAILAALELHADPVEALISLQPESAVGLAEPRLLRVMGQEKAEWMTEGDKLRLHRAGTKFIDITEHEHFYSQQVNTLAGKACE
jgi:leucyl aminopeptidase